MPSTMLATAATRRVLPTYPRTFYANKPGRGDQLVLQEDVLSASGTNSLDLGGGLGARRNLWSTDWDGADYPRMPTGLQEEDDEDERSNGAASARWKGDGFRTASRKEPRDTRPQSATEVCNQNPEKGPPWPSGRSSGHPSVQKRSVLAGRGWPREERLPGRGGGTESVRREAYKRELIHISLATLLLLSTSVVGQIPSDALNKVNPSQATGGEGTKGGGGLTETLGLDKTLNGLGLNGLDLRRVLDIDWDNNDQLLNLLGDEDKGKLKVATAAKKGKKKEDVTDEEMAEEMRESMAKSDSGKEREKAKQDEKQGRSNFFYAYGMQSVGDVVQPKWVLLFDSAFTANQYFGKIQNAYKAYYKNNRHGCSERPSRQIFIYPHGVGPAELEKTKEFTQFTGKVFYSPATGPGVQLSAIPHQDWLGNLPARKAS
ncbi:hypothetical protein BJX70DRAFT_398958 [Aspergillus crustosus]